MAPRLDVPIPRRMRGLRVDPRGYPEPWNLMVDKTGKAHFTINDSTRTAQSVAELRCGICGQEHDADGMWFVGGPLSAFHPAGAYIDPPVHHQCGQYALRVCPYLAAPNWNNKTIGMRVAQSIPEENVPDGIVGFKDVSQPGLDTRPALFVFVKAHSYSVTLPDHHLRPVRPYLDVEFWLHGQQIGAEQAEAILAEVANTMYDEA